MIAILAELLTLLATIILFSNSVACFRSKDFYAKMQYAKVIGLYCLNLIIIAKLILAFNTENFIKCLTIISLNIYLVLLLCRILTRSAIIQKTLPDCQKVSLVKNNNKKKKGKIKTSAKNQPKS